MKRLAALFLCLAATFATGQALDLAKPDPVVEARVKTLGEELRCLVCQNQTIADSAAPLALDLRNQIRTQIAQGRSDDQIRTYMVERYGDFVLYKPPFKATTAVLWVGPFALALLGIGVIVLIVRRKRPAEEPATAASAARRAEVARLLDDEAKP